MTGKRGTVSTKVVAIVSAAVLVLGGAAWGLFGRSDNAEKNPLNLPENLLVDALKEQMKESPEKMIGTMRGLRQDEQLTDAQRRAARRNVGRVWRERLDESVNEYFAASDDEKNAILDRQIDEMLTMRKRMEAERARREAERKQNGDATEDQEARRQEWRSRRAGQTRTERKSRSESRSPDQSARRMAYFSAMRDRAKERGIELGGPRGRGGNRGHRP